MALCAAAEPRPDVAGTGAACLQPCGGQEQLTVAEQVRGVKAEADRLHSGSVVERARFFAEAAARISSEVMAQASRVSAASRVQQHSA